MQARNRFRLALWPVAVAIVATLFIVQYRASAVDHADAPETVADPAADLASFYAWAEGGRFTAIVTFGWQTMPTTYDPEMLYSLHIDTDNDNLADHTIHMRFGRNSLGQWGVQALDVPGAGTVSGPVETVLEQGGVKLFVGHRDDPSFYDVAGMTSTLATGTLSFTAADGLAGKNVKALALEFAVADLGGATTVRAWATSARYPVGTP